MTSNQEVKRLRRAQAKAVMRVQFIRGAFTAISAEGQAALNEMLESALLDREVRND